MQAMNNAVTAFAPATVSNVACGFDVLGFALHEPGDEVTARWIEGPSRVVISGISHDGGRLPRDAAKNTAGIAAAAVLQAVGITRGVALGIRKGLPLSSGLGGSASPAALSLPKDQWDEIAEKTRKEYLTGFREALAHMKEQDAPRK